MKGWKNNNDPWVPLDVQDELKHPPPTWTSPQPNNSTDTEQDLAVMPENQIMKSRNGNMNMPTPPADPLHTLIDSERYIQSLERKLNALRKKKENPSSKDIIDSLALLHEDQMRNCMNSDSHNIHDTVDYDRTLTPSYMKRKLFPELQAVNTVETAELVKEDFVEKLFDENDADKSVSANDDKDEKLEVNADNCDLSSDVHVCPKDNKE